MLRKGRWATGTFVLSIDLFVWDRWGVYRFHQLLWKLAGVWPGAARRRLWLPDTAVSLVQPEHKFAISAIVRNEEDYVDEWLEFHLMQGATHFFIYDNGSTDRTVEKFTTSVHASRVTLVQWSNFLAGWEGVTGPTGRMQRLAMLHCIANFGHLAEWIAFIDVDEFLYPVAARDMIEILGLYDDLESLSVFWNMFGTSGHVTPPNGLVTENYTRRRRAPCSSNKHLCRAKTIVRPRSVRGVHNSHTLILRNGHPESWTERRVRIGYSDHNLNLFSNDVVRINHYYSKSLEEYRSRRHIPSEGARRDFRKNDDLLDLIEADSVKDTTIQRFLPELKRRLAARLTLADDKVTPLSTIANGKLRQ